MAVEFKEKSFTITIDTGRNPIEDWLELHNELVEVLSLMDMMSAIGPMPHRVLRLLTDMMPDWEVAKKMTTGSENSIK